MVDFLMGPWGAAALYLAGAGLVLSFLVPFSHALFGLSDTARRGGMVAAAGLMSLVPLWMAAFYGSALFLADFRGDWRGPVLVTVLALISAGLAATAALAIRRVLTIPSMDDI